MGFGDVNIVVQTTSIQLGLDQACVEMKDKYVDTLEGNNVLYLYLDVQHQGSVCKHDDLKVFLVRDFRRRCCVHWSFEGESGVFGSHFKS